MAYKWAYCLTEDQLIKLVRNIKKVPGFLEYLDSNDGDDFRQLLLCYKALLVEQGITTPGIRTNLDMLYSKYDLFQKEYADSPSQDDNVPFDLNKVLTWRPRPQWASNMTVLEIDYLDHFIWQVEGLPKFLHDDPKAPNLYDKVCQYQLILNATGQNDPEKNFALETIKERFYRIMNDHKDAIHYVNHSHQIDDHALIDQFLTEAKESFYIADLTENVCSDFLNKYQKTSNPYIASEIFCKLFRANKVDQALYFAKQAFTHIFSSPNLYWNNKEAIYGCANILYMIVEALDVSGGSSLEKKSYEQAETVLQSLYHLFSRVIYWSDRETNVKEVYDDDYLPINIQHKIRAFRMRSYLIMHFPDVLLAEIPGCDSNMMGLADLNSAHFMAYSNNIVGKNSVFYQDVIKVFHESGLYKRGDSIEKLANMGFQMNDALAMSIHEKYKAGKFVLSETEITELIESLGSYFDNIKINMVQNHEPIPYLEKDHFSPSYKTSRNEIMQYLLDNGINCLYHFTDSDKLDSIIRHGGLLSYKRCLDEAIVMPIRDDMALSRDIDAEFGLEDYARLSFCDRLPKIKERLGTGKDLIMLKVSIEVATFEDTVFADMEATSPLMSHGASFEDLKKVNLAVTQKSDFGLSDKEYLQRQAEVLVKGFIPLKYIQNIKNPEKIMS